MTRRVSSIPGETLSSGETPVSRETLANAATQCSTRVLPFRVSNCLGRAAPNRVPVPPPSTTATMCFTVTSADFTRVRGEVPRLNQGLRTTLRSRLHLKRLSGDAPPYRRSPRVRGGGHGLPECAPVRVLPAQPADAVEDLRGLRRDHRGMAHRGIGPRRGHRA